MEFKILSVIYSFLVEALRNAWFDENVRQSLDRMKNLHSDPLKFSVSITTRN